jgi:hypothetical protein
MERRQSPGDGAQDKILHGRAALLRRPRVQGRAAALPYQEGEVFGHTPPGDQGKQKGISTIAGTWFNGTELKHIYG